MGTVMVQIPVDEATAAALVDPRRLAAVSELVMAVVQPTAEDDPLDRLLRTINREAAEAGITEADIDAELAAWKAERAARST
jgi:hypothetical protein